MIKLKNILNEVLTEARRRRTGSGVLEWDVVVDGLHIPAICVPTDTLRISVDIDYNFLGGSPNTGMFGSAYDETPEEGPEVELLGHVVKSVIATSPNGQERQIYYEHLLHQQQEILDNAVDGSIHHNEGKIEEAILDKEG